jgi:hypothetical protein
VGKSNQPEFVDERDKGVCRMTQGYEANHGGKWLEDIVEREFFQRGFLVRDYCDDQDNTDLFSPNRLVRNVPYTSIYGCSARSEFLIVSDVMMRRVRIECRMQASSGSVDEKMPYLLLNAKEAMPENEVMLLLGGDGARAKAVDWLRRQARAVANKQIHVLTINEFPNWAREFVKPLRCAA